MRPIGRPLNLSNPKDRFYLRLCRLSEDMEADPTVDPIEMLEVARILEDLEGAIR